MFLVDSPDPAANPNLDFVLCDMAAAIRAWRDDGKTVYLHCVAGESRTPTVAAAYLADRLGISGRDALDRLRPVLPSTRPNGGFLAALDRLWPPGR